VLAPSGPQPPLTSRSSQRRKLSLFMPLHRLEISAPLAALGAASLARGRVRGRLYGLALLLAWTAAAIAGILALWAGSTVPAHRLLAFCLAIPMLGAALAVALLRASRRLGPVAVAAGVAVVLSGLAGQAFITHTRWFDLARPAMAGPTFDRYPAALSEALAQAATAGEYVERYAGNRGVVYVVPSLRYQGIEPGRVALSAIRAAVPPDQITRTAVYIGAPARLLAGRPTFLPGARRFNFASRRFWEGARALQDPLVIRLEAFTPTDPNVSLAPLGAEIAPGVHIVSGPVVQEIGLAPGPSPPSTTGLIVLTSLVVVFLAVTGAGWAAALARGPFWQWIFLSPAFGITTLACFGLIADAAGLSLDRAGLPIVLSATLLGWLVFGVRLRVGRLSVSGDPEIAPGPDRFR
jgi:hypothetical protein